MYRASNAVVPYVSHCIIKKAGSVTFMLNVHIRTSVRHDNIAIDTHYMQVTSCIRALIQDSDSVVEFLH